MSVATRPRRPTYGPSGKRKNRYAKGMELLARRVRVAELYAKGTPIGEIVKLEDFSMKQVYRDITWIHQEWLNKITESRNEMVAREIAKIDTLEMTYWKAWEESKKPLETSRTERAQMGDDDSPKQRRTRASLVTRKRDGNPAFLQGVMSCIDRRSRLLGLDAPVRVDLEEDVRAWAVREGLDPDAAVREAARQIKLLRAEEAEFRQVSDETPVDVKVPALPGPYDDA